MVATEQIVIELCKETGEPGLSNNQTLWGCVFDAIRDLSLHAMPCWGTIEGLTANNLNAICWPKACVKPLMTFVTRNGRSFALSVDDSLLGTINKTNFNGTADQALWEFYRTDLFYAVAPYVSWNFGLGEIYGLPSDAFKTGIVTYDQPNRRSFINGVSVKSSDTYGMFFSSDGLSVCPEWVPSQCKEAIEFFSLAKYYRTRNPNLGELNRKNYKEEFHRLSSYEIDEGLTAWIDAMRSNVMSAPKL